MPIYNNIDHIFGRTIYTPSLTVIAKVWRSGGGGGGAIPPTPENQRKKKPGLDRVNTCYTCCQIIATTTLSLSLMLFSFFQISLVYSSVL